MKSRLLISTHAAGRLDAARRWLEATAEHGGEILVLSPSRGAADDLLRRACPSGAGFFGVHRATPLQLAAELATRAMASRGLAPVSALGAEALAARSIARCRAAGTMPYFAPVAETPGLARALARTLRELRTHHVERSALAATGAPGADLAQLLSTYESELEHWSLADEARLWELAAETVDDDDNHYLVGLPLLVLDLSPVSAAERRFLRSFAAHAPDVLATAAGGDDEGRGALEEILGVAAEPLDEPLAQDAAPTRSGATRLERLRRDVFQIKDVVQAESAAEEPAADDDSVIFLTAPGEGRECVEIARRIRDLAADGVPFDHIAVLLRDPNAYLPLLEEALRRARIPACFTRGTVRPHPAGRAFLALLACAAEDFSASRFAEYLSLGQVPELDASGAPPVVEEVPWVEPEGDQLVFKSFLPLPDEDEEAREDAAAAPQIGEHDEVVAVAGTLQTPRRWEQLLVDAAVLGGRQRWEERLEGLGRELELRLRELADDEVTRRRRLERQRWQLVNLERFALPVIDDLAALPGTATWGEWLKALYRLAGRVLRHPDKVLTLLADLRPMDQVGPVTLDEVRRVLEERLTFLRTEPPARRYGRVFVATVEEARGREFETVFLPGLAEGIFPRRQTEDPLLLDVYREQLPDPLPTQHERVARERLLLRLAAGAARRRLVVSYPNLDALLGRARVPSFYALDVLRAAEGRLPRQRDLEMQAASESASILGWPAPRTPERAIDDAEFDLSTLAGLLRGKEEKKTSRGRYMLEANPALQRSLRGRWQRWHPKFTPADGLVDPAAAAREALEEHRLHRRSYSPTALQAYAACPYRFLLYAILRLRPRDEVAPLEQLDPLTRGSLFHEVQFELFGELRDKGLLPMREADLKTLFDHADATLGRIAERYREELRPAIPRVWSSEIKGLGTDLRGWIKAVVAAGESWRPSYFELSFGLPHDGGHDAASRREPVTVLDGVRLRGSIDVVESDDARKVVRVTDHKTGRAIKARHLTVGAGETLQPLLYALAAENMLGQPVESGRLFYCTRRGEYKVVEVRLDDDGRRRIAQVLETIDHAVAEGFLPAAPRQGACRFCDYQAVCGPFEEQRLGHKRRERLVRLESVRGMA